MIGIKSGEEPGAALPPARSGPATVLLVEDDQQVRLATVALLGAWGYRVLAAETDEQALWLWGRHGGEVDVLLTDLMIPEQTLGTDLARRFRGERPGLRVILTSGFGPDIAYDVADFPRDLPFLQKPYDPEILRAILQALTSGQPD